MKFVTFGSPTTYPHSSIPSCFRTLLRPLRPRLPPVPDPLQDVFSILVDLQLRHHHFTRRHADGHRLPVRLLPHHALDVDDVLKPVHGCDFALATLVGAARDEDFVVFAEGDGADLGRVSEAVKGLGWRILMEGARMAEQRGA